MRTLTIDIGWPLAKDYGQNGAHGNYHAVNEMRSKARSKTLALVKQQAMRLIGPRFEPFGYVLVAMSNRHIDADNIVARCKSFLDGSADAFGIDDNKLELFGVIRKPKSKDGDKILLVFTDAIPEEVESFRNKIIDIINDGY